jgi:ferredoxin
MKVIPKDCLVELSGQRIPAKVGQTVKAALVSAGETPHGGGSELLHCPSVGTCGTCAMAIDGPISEMTPMERWRLNFPPHRLDQGLRLACQARVLGDVMVEKREGFWGQKPE